MRTKTIEGFTLIEMLVVVAIVGILSAVVLTALGPSRAKARDARIISGISQVRVMAEIFFSNNGGNYCPGPVPNGCLDETTTVPNVDSLRIDIANNGGALVINSFNSSGNPAFAASSRLVSDNTKFYCVDAEGRAGIGGNPGNAPNCP